MFSLNSLKSPIQSLKLALLLPLIMLVLFLLAFGFRSHVPLGVTIKVILLGKTGSSKTEYNKEDDSFHGLQNTTILGGTDMLSDELKKAVFYHAYKRSIDPLLVESIIKFESDYKTHAESHAGAKGLMQLMDDTGRWMMDLMQKDPDDYHPFDGKLNIELGVFYLHYLLNKFLTPRLALAAYNWGEGNVGKLLRAADSIDLDKTYDTIEFRLPKETRKYVFNVMSHWEKLKDGKAPVDGEA